VGFTALSAPVRNHFGNVVAALSINGPSARLRPDVLRNLVGPVCEAANRISRRLGATQEMLGEPPTVNMPDAGTKTARKPR